MRTWMARGQLVILRLPRVYPTSGAVPYPGSNLGKVQTETVQFVILIPFGCLFSTQVSVSIILAESIPREKSNRIHDLSHQLP